MIENSVYLLAASIRKTEMNENFIFIYRRKRNNDESLSMRKQVLKFALFFETNLPASVEADRESKPPPILPQTRKIANENILGPDILHKDRSSMRCIIISSHYQEAVCRECLAMHRESLAIRTYFLFYRTSRSSAELCVFRSIHETIEFISSCKGTFCSRMRSWEPSECEKVVEIFSMQRQGSKKRNEMHDETNQSSKPLNSYEKSKNSGEITQILEYLARKRMARISSRSSAKLQVLAQINTLGIREGDELVCVNVTSLIDTNTECVSNI